MKSARRKTRRSAFGARRKTTKSAKCQEGEVKISMCVRDVTGKGSKNCRWMSLPGNMGVQKGIAEKWYLTLQVAKGVKLVFIKAMQECVKACYYQKIPSWFKRAIKSSASEKVVNEYFEKARRILFCMNLYDQEAAGWLLTAKSVKTAKYVSGLKFKSYDQLKTDCKYEHSINKMPKNVFELLNMFRQNIYIDEPQYPGQGGEFFNAKMHCREIYQATRKVVEFVIKFPHQVDNILAANGFMTIKELQQREQQKQNISSAPTGSMRGSQAEDNALVGPVTPSRSVVRANGAAAAQNRISENQNRARAAGFAAEAGNLAKQAGDAASKLSKMVGFGRRRRRSGFGWSATTTPMIGFVRPFRSSAMEQYTGMTPRMYRRHIGSRTGTPMGVSRPNLARANDYYGSWRLGERLNPMNRFGRRRASHDSDDDSDDEEPKRRTTRRRTTRRKTTTKRKTATKRKTTTRRKSPAKKRTTTKRRTTRRRTAKRSSFGRFFF